MFMSLISHLLSAWFAFLLPCFSTFKALNHLPHSEPELKRWAMYWSIVGVFVAFEYVAQWFISWLPFYWEIKTLFLLYLSLPQTQGSTYIYQTYVHPFLIKNEAALDAGIEALQSNALTFLQAKLADLFRLITNAAPKNNAAGAQGQATPGATGASADPNAAAWQAAAAGLFSTYGASVINALRPGAAAGAGTPNAATPGAGVRQQQQRSNPTTPNKPRTSTSGSSTAIPRVNPPFPVPQHFQQPPQQQQF